MAKKTPPPKNGKVQITLHPDLYATLVKDATAQRIGLSTLARQIIAAHYQM